MQKTKFRLIGLAAALLFLLAACQPSSKPESNDDPAIDSIIVLPSQVGEPSASTTPSEKEKQLAVGTQTLNTLLADYFSGKAKVRLLNELPTDNLTLEEARTPTAMARAIGRQMGGDAVLAVTLSRFAERHGNEYDVSHPASVAFELKLIAVATGKTLWVGSFDKTQQSLSDNLLAVGEVLRRRFTWVTAESLARDGLQEKLSACKYLAP